MGVTSPRDISPSPPAGLTSSASSSRNPVKRYTSRTHLAARKTSLEMRRRDIEEGSESETIPTRLQRKRRRQNSISPVLDSIVRRVTETSTPQLATRENELTSRSTLSKASTPPAYRPRPPPSTPPRSLRRTVSHPSQSSPRDLSGHFSPVSSPGEIAAPLTPKRPGGMRRMLTKTQSLGEPAEMASAESFPMSSPFSSPVRSIDTPSRSLLNANAIEETDVTLFERPATTYGSRRTVQITQALPAEEDDDGRQTYAELRHKYEVANEDGWLTDTARAPLPITDMRSRGENRRFLDEIGYLVEGLRDGGSSLSSRRSGSFDILRNLQDETWVSKVQVCDQSTRLWSSLMEARGQSDTVIDAIALLFLSFCATSPIGLESISQHAHQQCLDMINNGMQRNGSLEAVMSIKGNTSQAAKVCELIRSLLKEQNAKVPRSIGEWLFARFFDIKPDACVSSFPALLHCLQSEVSRKDCDTSVLYANLKSISRMIVQEPSLEVDSQSCRCLSEAMDIAKSRAAADELAFPIIFELLQILIYASQSVKLRLQPHTVAWLTLRTSHIAEALGEGDVSSKDILSLILAMLTTAMTVDAAFSTSMANISLSATCGGNNICETTCHCADRDIFVHHLARLYVKHVQLDTKVDEVIRGYVAIIVAKLLIDCPDCRTSLLARIPGANPKEGLENLLSNLKHLGLDVGSGEIDDTTTVSVAIEGIENLLSAVS